MVWRQALDPEAVNNIFKAKGRPNDNPLIVHIADLSALPDVVSEVPEKARVLMERFWPGPLTIVLPRNPQIPDETTAGPGHRGGADALSPGGTGHYPGKRSAHCGTVRQSVRPAQPHHSRTLHPGSHR